ncbi:amidase [Alphaproteobacteria bacterium]|nr:amidase [Alphaproteobacteria bacterium]
MSKTNAIIGMPAWELSEHIHTKKVSCKEVMTIFLDHIDKVNPKINGIVALQDRDDLLRQAEEKDRVLASGESDGWMHGFPQAAKDLEDNMGIPSTWGSLVLKDNIPKADALMTRRLKSAGSIMIGRTNTPEHGLGSHTYNKVYGTTRNPYDQSLSAGGSSGGAAASVATGTLPVADGTDFMGSLRNPAGWCNVYGFRPSWGRVPGGVELFMNNFSTKGSMGRNVADIALHLASISGYYPAIPFSMEKDPDLDSLTPKNVNARLRADHKGKKIAWLGNWEGHLPMEDGVTDLCEQALKYFNELGMQVEAAAPLIDGEFFWNEIWLPLRHFAMTSQKANCENPEKRKLVKPELIYEYEGSLRYSAQDIYAATMKRSDLFRNTLKLFDKYDYFALPTAQLFAFDAAWDWPKEIAGKKMNSYHRWMEVVAVFTMIGCPVVGLPAGFNAMGKSMGLQIMGKPRGDFDVLQLAHAYEQVADWVNRFPPELLKL